MTLLTMTIPDDPAELARWLERRLMAPDFGRFVAELSAHFPAAPGAPQPRHLLDRWLPVALDEGLEPIPADVLVQLLRHPAVLAAFRERVVTDGGAYWDDVPATSDDLSGRFERGKRSLERVLSTDGSPRGGEATPSAWPKASPSGGAKRTGAPGYKIWAIVSTGVAACLVVAVVWQAGGRPDDRPIPKAQIAWGWGKPGGLATDQSNPKDYLNKLAANAEEWSLHRPGDASGVGTRIAELRLGCTRLMHSTYGPLTPDDRAWLLEHCRAWAKVLDRHQQALDAGTDPLAVRAEVDEAVRGMAVTLREKARRVG
jgi:hypothetical protein